MAKTLIAAVLAGIVLFFWGFLSWAVIPWHDAVIHKLSDEAAVSQVLQDNADKRGIYYFPHAEEDNKPGIPMAFISFQPEGPSGGMGAMMGKAIIGQILSALLIALLLLRTEGLTYWQRVGFVTLSGLAVGFISHFPYWNWFGFSTGYVAINIADFVIAYFLAGLVLARFITGRSTAN